ncbi:hypothetical protein BDZ85DRAFT_262751 [Elsinoe ampelina]|uniref:Uncharacterized protein n=1 Tax=Elsinoe ampelina TaxID=302913 RepID=A0A6A6GB80_9PEZI|nr:hypothetical protein BDZ85DRAFT_262751 [Elsinoe ampelina]
MKGRSRSSSTSSHLSSKLNRLDIRPKLCYLIARRCSVSNSTSSLSWYIRTATTLAMKLFISSPTMLTVLTLPFDNGSSSL